jgi:hypothetical protein
LVQLLLVALMVRVGDVGRWGLAVPMHRVAHVVWHRFARTGAPTFVDLISKRRDVGLRRVVADRGGLTDRVDLDGLHAVDAAKHAVEDGLLTRPLETGRLEDHSFDGRFVLPGWALVVMVGVQLGLSLRVAREGRYALENLISDTMW